MKIRRWPAAARLASRAGETAGGVLLILGAVTAFVWANSTGASIYFRIWQVPIGYGMTLHAGVNDGLMSLFFLMAGIEIRREMTGGQLATWRGIAAPGIAALGGMLAPALIYMAVAHGHSAAWRGWAVPVATDIAFSLAIVRILGKRIDESLRVFLTALAILDDLGAIIVIAIFFNRGLGLWYLAGAAGVCAALLLFRLLAVARFWPYALGGAALWVLIFTSGVNATVSGVTLAFVLPRPLALRIEHRLTSVVSYAILPLFALANAGVRLTGMDMHVLLSPAPLGAGIGLLFGKQIGVFGATMLGRAAGILHLPEGMRIGELYGLSLLCGIGFTMSLFIADLAFHDTELHAPVKLAVLAASVASGCGGALVLARVGPRAGHGLSRPPPRH